MCIQTKLDVMHVRVRQYKILNCKNYHLTQVRTDFYDDFWGEGLRAAPKNKRNTQLA